MNSSLKGVFLGWIFGEVYKLRTSNVSACVPTLTAYRIKYNSLFLFSVPLGSIPELPAQSCKEIKASEGEAMSKKYWLSTIKQAMSVLASCDMNTEGEFSSKRYYSCGECLQSALSLEARLGFNSKRTRGSFKGRF